MFLPREFRDLGGEDQVLRVLRILVREKRLVRLGYGVYGRAVVSRLSGDPILYSQSGFLGAARQALTKLGVKWEPSEAESDYNEGRSTQIPLNPVVRVNGEIFSPTPRRQAGASACAINRLYRIFSKFKSNFDLPSPVLVEKDWYVARALAAINSADVKPFRLVFSGGTALSRAHRLTRRMSEDIDLKSYRMNRTHVGSCVNCATTLPAPCCMPVFS